MAGSRGGDESGVPASGDDRVLPFKTVRSGVAGRLVRLGPALDAILRRHDYPDVVSRLLGEAATLAVMLGSALRFDSAFGGKFILQTKTDGPVGFLVASYDQSGAVRAYASFDAERLSALLATNRAPRQGELLGHGHLAMTIDPGGNLDRYQGIVPLDGSSLVLAAHTYFKQSEQIPTFLRVAVAGHMARDGQGGDRSMHWRAGGLLVQYMPSVDQVAGHGAADEEAGRVAGEADEGWQSVRILAATVEDHELIDPTVAAETLLFRLFHEEGVRAMPSLPLADRCTCSRDKVGAFLRQFGASELADMRESDGAVSVTCEFCTTRYRFMPEEFA